MSDPTINAIDKLFDLVDRGVDHVDRVLNRNKHTQENAQEKVRARRKRAEVIETEATPKAPPKPASAAPSAALVRKPHFYIVESVTPAGTLFVVTDGGKARTECSTREFAEKILRALEAGT